MTGRFALPMFAIACAAFAATEAYAQCRLCETPTTQRAESTPGTSIDIEVEAGLDFDRLILLGEGGGSATLRPDGTRHVSGEVGTLSMRAMVGEGLVRGEPGRAVRITLPRRIELHSLNGGRIAIEEIVSDVEPGARLDSAGLLQFRFGGRLEISGDAEGDYRGDVPITVEYL
jgi:hypothetical protein